MFCPNCAAENADLQNFCRRCGLKLDAIAADLAAQTPSAEYGVILKQKRRFEVFGLFSLLIAGLIGIGMLLGKVFYYKLILFGPEVLFYSAFGALALFGLLSVFFFNYPKLFMNFDTINSRLPTAVEQPVVTNKLLDDPPFEPASVTENSTEMLSVERKR